MKLSAVLNKHLAVIGAGPVGLTASILLGQRGFNVDIFEKRTLVEFEAPPDNTKVLGTSFTRRGQEIVQQAGLKDVYGVELPKTKVHLKDKSYEYYMGRKCDAFFSLNRQKLLRDLLEETKKYNHIKINWNHKLVSVDYENETKIKVVNDQNDLIQTQNFDAIIAADGCYSGTRTNLQYKTMMNYEQEFSKYGYLYIEIPPKNENQEYAFEKNVFHIFSRGEVFAVVLPEPYGRFSASFYFPWTGPSSYPELLRSNTLKEFIQQHFTEIYQAVPDFDSQLSIKTLRRIMCIHLDPWHYGNLCFIGDAAHSLFPFYGAGLNTGLEDVGVLIDLIDNQRNQTNINWKQIFTELQADRKQDTDAILELTKQRMNMLNKAMQDPSYEIYRQTLDYLNDTFPETFWSVERLIRYSRVKLSKVLKYQNVEYEIVNECNKIDGFKNHQTDNGDQNIRTQIQHIVERQYNDNKDICQFIRDIPYQK